MGNNLEIPYINPVKFVRVNPQTNPKYFTKHFDDYLFADRLLPWEQREDYIQIWQTTDNVPLQFESEFDPIIVYLLDQYGNKKITLPALNNMPNKFKPGYYCFEILMALSSITKSGCYRFQIEAGSGSEKEYYISGRQHISTTPYTFPNFMLEYWHDRFHLDIMFETGWRGALRLPGHFGKLIPGVKNEIMRDEKYNNTILSSRTFRQFPLYHCDEYGIPEDVLDQLNGIWTCRNVTVDRELYAAVDGKFEEVKIPGYPKSGVKLLVEPGINRNSKVFSQTIDTTQRIISSIPLDMKVFGDLSNAGSTNAMPVINME